MSETETIEQVETQVETTTAPEAETIKGEPYDAARAMATIEKLRSEIRDLKPKAKKAEELAQAEEQRKQAEMTELQKLQASLEKAQAELKAAKIAEMKNAIAAKVNLPLAFADRLQGETPEELEADAKKLLEALPKPQPPKVSPTSPSGASPGETIAQQRARVYGSGVSPLDPAYAKAHGGGVVWNEKE
jgi:hypothetical protein